MKILATRPERCTGCGKCEIACSLTWFKVEDREKSRIRISPPAAQGENFIITVCNQNVACIDVCPVHALTRAKSGVVQLNKKLCIGFLNCVGFCPNLRCSSTKNISSLSNACHVANAWKPARKRRFTLRMSRMRPRLSQSAGCYRRSDRWQPILRP